MLPFLIAGAGIMGSLVVVDALAGAIGSIKTVSLGLKNKQLKREVDLGLGKESPVFLKLSPEDLPQRMHHLCGIRWCLSEEDKTHLFSMLRLEMIGDAEGSYEGLMKKSEKRLRDPRIASQKPPGF